MGVFVGSMSLRIYLDWVVGEQAELRPSPNTSAGVRRLVRCVGKLVMDLVVVESTGGYERALAERLSDAGLPVVVVNPWRVRRFGEALGILAQTDPLDARILALYGERARLERRPLPGPRQRQLADLVRRRLQLIAMIVAEKSRLDTASPMVRRDMRCVVGCSSAGSRGSTSRSTRPLRPTRRRHRTGANSRAFLRLGLASPERSSSLCPSSEH